MKKYLLVSLVIVGLMGAGQVKAFDIEAMRQRLAQAQAERQERLVEMRSDLGIEETGSEGSQNTNEDSSDLDLNESGEQDVEQCECKARLSLAKPEVQWTSAGLVFVPTFDVKVNVRDERPEERWNLRLDWAALSQFEPGEGVTAPANQALGGSHTWGGSCVNTKLSFNGHAEDAMTLGQMARSMFVEDTELKGMVTERARLTGCDQEEVHRQFSIKVKEFGNLRLGGWRSAR